MKLQVVRIGVLLAAAAITLLAASGSARAAARPPAFVVNSDDDFDAVAALAYLGEAARSGHIDLRAVSVEISGFAPAGPGLSQTRCELAKLGLSNIPSSDGDLTAVNPFPDFFTSIDPVIERAVRPNPATPCPSVSTEVGAARLLVQAILSSPGKVTVVNQGPLTNVAEALRMQPSIASKIKRVYALGGGIGHGNVFEPGFDGSQEYNFWANAPAAQSVFRALGERVFMTGLDATDHVPVAADFRLQLGAHLTTAAANVVYSMASDPLFVGQEGLGELYWWDALNAVASISGGVVSYKSRPIDVVQNGPSTGRTVVSRSGSHVHVGLDADTARWTDKMVAGLNGSF
jgi:inosine-uridine nucleoside N-ribohydrolase